MPKLLRQPSEERAAPMLHNPYIVSVRPESLAVNLFDITDTDRVPETIRDMLLGGKLDLANAIRVDPSRFDEVAVEFTCDLLTAACICDTLRQHDRTARQHPTRVYVRKATAWNKVPGDAKLALVKGEKLFLNPSIFTPVEAAPRVAVTGARKML